MWPGRAYPEGDDLKDRRQFLKAAGTLASGLAACSHDALAWALATPSNQSGIRTPASIQRYIDPLPIPATLKPADVRKGTTAYSVRMREFEQRLHSQLSPTRLWGYNAQYPGPTIEARSGSPIVVDWHNDLPTTHLFPVDSHIHGAMAPAPAVRAVPHLHGISAPPSSDGLPELWFLPGHSVRYHYPNAQPAAPLWYHDHALGITRLNLYAGLSGFYMLRDEEEDRMSLPAGEYEIPLMLQDKALDDHGQLIYAPSNDDGVKLPPGVWGPEFYGAYPVVNGAIYPYLDVEPRLYRLRLVNAANSRFFRISFDRALQPTDAPKRVKFLQIGTDGGFLPKVVALEQLLLGGAERADVLIDFTGLEDQTVTLRNNASAPFPNLGMAVMEREAIYEMMQFRVRRPMSKQNVAFTFPPVSRFPALVIPEGVVTRDLVIGEKMDASGKSLGVRINEKGYDDPVTETARLGDTEVWRFINTTEDAHPMHLHLVAFRIISRQGFDMSSWMGGTMKLSGAPRPPQPNEQGWKDTAIVSPGEMLSILVKFSGFKGKFVYHCHMIEHEDNDMMRPFEVT